MESTIINLVPQCTSCGHVLDTITLIYQIDESGNKTIFSPSKCPKCSREISQIVWPHIPLYKDSEDGDSTTINRNLDQSN